MVVNSVWTGKGALPNKQIMINNINNKFENLIKNGHKIKEIQVIINGYGY